MTLSLNPNFLSPEGHKICDVRQDEDYATQADLDQVKRMK